MTKLTGSDDLREWLTSQGFRTWQDGLAHSGNACNWYATRKTHLQVRECEGNKGKLVQILVKPYEFTFRGGDTASSVEVDVTGEANGIWYKLQAYSLSHDDLRGRLDEIESSLIAAWNAAGEQT
jgi:hypothetical protein